MRDVSYLHIRTLENPNAKGQRFIASADEQISLQGIAELIGNKKPEVSLKVAKRKLPNWSLKIAYIFMEQAQETLFMTKINRNVSNSKAKNVLGWNPIASQEETILALINSMTIFNLINKNQK